MISEWELWAVASHLVELHGEAAAEEARARQLELEAKGDTGGVNAWTAILARIEQIIAAPPATLN